MELKINSFVGLNKGRTVCVFIITEDGKKLETKLNEKEVIEVTFMIYVPQGSNLKLQDTRKSTWLNPLVDGKEAKKLMGG